MLTKRESIATKTNRKCTVASQDVLLEKGENARRRVLNRDELVQGWRREFTKAHDVVVIEPNQLGNDHAEHVATAHECTVIITPWGGVSFFALFARKDTTVIFCHTGT